MQYIIMEKTLIKLLHHDETKKRAHDSQIVRAKEKTKVTMVITYDQGYKGVAVCMFVFSYMETES